jgi:hypothetical protein
MTQETAILDISLFAMEHLLQWFKFHVTETQSLARWAGLAAQWDTAQYRLGSGWIIANVIATIILSVFRLFRDDGHSSW